VVAPFPAERLKRQAVTLGFNRVGLTAATPSPQLDAYLAWIDAGMHGSMGYMARPDRVDRRRDLNVILDGARTLIVVALDYHALNIPEAALTNPARGRIASYAWGVDYHDVMTPRLEVLADWLRVESGGDVRHRVYVDTGALLERSHGQQAGLGFTGKNTLLIDPRGGSYFFLGVLLTDLAFDALDAPHTATMCGSCTACLTACPTAAFPRPYVLDARRCISYLTIEHRGMIDRSLRPLMANWVYGCDICQDVCPWQRFALPTREDDFRPLSHDDAAPRLLDLLALDDASFRARFATSPIGRIKRDRLVRNACIAAGNWGDRAALPALEPLLNDSAPLVRAHAAWAWLTISGDASRLRTLREHEPDADVRAEYDALLTEEI
jgi:epoxyqueuosine reductase